ncbi:hypothetical protein BL1487 [Bifidobacterium longum NCC2705]|uniref:Uncharacterized protein n=1 Tax=Bifidobacterium longum (strain NCC 2705) TaxID=206672 RepID=Q8G4A1_BIFLO|nr:hypothetical protein BL1487 [Bifidobacterium longum NCC2705]
MASVMAFSSRLSMEARSRAREYSSCTLPSEEEYNRSPCSTVWASREANTASTAFLTRASRLAFRFSVDRSVLAVACAVSVPPAHVGIRSPAAYRSDRSLRVSRVSGSASLSAVTAFACASRSPSRYSTSFCSAFFAAAWAVAQSAVACSSSRAAVADSCDLHADMPATVTQAASRMPPAVVAMRLHSRTGMAASRSPTGVRSIVSARSAGSTAPPTCCGSDAGASAGISFPTGFEADGSGPISHGSTAVFARSSLPASSTHRASGSSPGPGSGSGSAGGRRSGSGSRAVSMATAVPAAIMGPISHGSVLEVFIGSGRGAGEGSGGPVRWRSCRRRRRPAVRAAAAVP